MATAHQHGGCCTVLQPTCQAALLKTNWDRLPDSRRQGLRAHYASGVTNSALRLFNEVKSFSSTLLLLAPATSYFAGTQLRWKEGEWLSSGGLAQLSLFLIGGICDRILAGFRGGVQEFVCGAWDGELLRLSSSSEGCAGDRAREWGRSAAASQPPGPAAGGRPAARLGGRRRQQPARRPHAAAVAPVHGMVQRSRRRDERCRG